MCEAAQAHREIEKTDCSVIIVQRPLLVLCGDIRRGPIEVVLPQGFAGNPGLLFAHPIPRGTHGTPKNLYVALVHLLRLRPLTVRLVDFLGRLVIRLELDLVADELRPLRWYYLGETPRC